MRAANKTLALSIARPSDKVQTLVHSQPALSNGHAAEARTR